MNIQMSIQFVLFPCHVQFKPSVHRSLLLIRNIANIHDKRRIEHTDHNRLASWLAQGPTPLSQLEGISCKEMVVFTHHFMQNICVWK